MAEHYYSKNPTVKSDPKEWQAMLRNNRMRFKTDAGVFSKGEVDFGSRLLVESFAMPEVKGDVLDVGCGYGPIGLSIAASFPDRNIHMVDVNERAMALANENAELNGIDNVKIYASNALSAVEAEDLAVVLTNPPIRAGKETVFKIYDGAFEKLAAGGELWIVIQKKQGAPSTMAYLTQVFGNVETMEKKKGILYSEPKNLDVRVHL